MISQEIIDAVTKLIVNSEEKEEIIFTASSDYHGRFVFIKNAYISFVCDISLKDIRSQARWIIGKKLGDFQDYTVYELVSA